MKPLDRPPAPSPSFLHEQRGTRAITQITLRIKLELHLNVEVSANIVTIFTAKWHFLNYNVMAET